MRKIEKLITFMIISGPPVEMPAELAKSLSRRGWQALRPGQIYALFWDNVLADDPSDAEKLMERVMEIHRVATRFGVNHMFKTVKSSEEEPRFPEIL